MAVMDKNSDQSPADKEPADKDERPGGLIGSFMATAVLVFLILLAMFPFILLIWFLAIVIRIPD
jgi:hypothetical protein